MKYTITDRKAIDIEPGGVCLPFPLVIVQGKKLKKKCCRKFKKGKRCKRCPGRKAGEK